MESELRIEFDKVTRDISERAININAKNYFVRSKEEEEYCLQNGDFNVAASYRLAIRCSQVYDISVFEAFCAIRRKDNSGETIFFLAGEKTLTDNFLASLAFPSFSQEQVEHPLIHLRRFFLIPDEMQEISQTNQVLYLRSVSEMEGCGCMTCSNLKRFTYFLTLCTIKMIERGTLQVANLAMPTGEEIWDILESSEKHLERYSINRDGFKEFFIENLEYRFVKDYSPPCYFVFSSR